MHYIAYNARTGQVSLSELTSLLGYQDVIQLLGLL